MNSWVKGAMIVFDPVHLKKKLERAIAAGREKGSDTSVWEEKLRRLGQAENEASQTYESLASRGWCLWRCNALNDDVILILRDELVTDFPTGYPIYLEQELEYLLELDDSTIRLIHEAKKLGGATITDVEEREK